MQPTYPTNVLTLSREVDECKPLPVGAQAVVHRLRHGPGDGTLAVRRFVDRILARLEEEKSLGAAYFDGAAALSAWSVVGPASTCSKYPTTYLKSSFLELHAILRCFEHSLPDHPVMF